MDSAEEWWHVHMAATKAWTLDELDRLPDDGNKYELVHGKIFVTPAPTPDHEMIAFRIRRILDPYVERHGLGGVFTPRGIVEHAGSRSEPDLLVRQIPHRGAPWDAVPLPILIVEIKSPTTRPNQHEEKRRLYAEIAVADYWIVDPERRVVTIVRPGHGDVTIGDTLIWQPGVAPAPLVVEVRGLFK